MNPNRSEMDRGTKLRFGVLLVLIVCGWGLLLAQTYSIAVRHQAEYFLQGERSARLRYPLPALRGRILDRNGTPLAWSERSWALMRTGSAPLSDDVLLELEAILGRRPSPVSEEACLVRRLTPGQVLVLNQLIRSGAPLRIAPRLERITAGNPRAKSVIGTVIEKQGELFGASGLEQTHDAALQGIPGAFSVIVDRYQNWIPSSWKLERAAVPGQDVQIPQTLAELEGGR